MPSAFEEPYCLHFASHFSPNRFSFFRKKLLGEIHFFKSSVLLTETVLCVLNFIRSDLSSRKSPNPSAPGLGDGVGAAVVNLDFHSSKDFMRSGGRCRD